MSEIKEKIAKQLMGSKTGLLSSTLAERLTIEKSIINNALEEMRQIQDVKKGSKSGLDNYRWTMTDMGRLNYRVDESLLTQTKKTTIETPQAAPIVEESPLEQKVEMSEIDFDKTINSIKLCGFTANQVTTQNAEESTPAIEKQAKRSPFNPEKVRELAYKLANFTGGNTPKIESYLFEWLEQNQPKSIVVGLSDEQVSDFYQSYFPNKHLWMNFLSMYKDWQKDQTFAIPQVYGDSHRPNWDDAPENAELYQVQGVFYDSGLKKLGSVEV